MAARTDERSELPRWPPLWQAVAAVGWSSFLAAAFGTMLCFALVDPQLIVDELTAGDPESHGGTLSRTAIYTLGFFFLWLIAVFMLRTEPP